MRKKPTRIVAPASYNLPASFSREIGRIIVRWAYFEYAMRRILWHMLAVNPKIGRIAVRDPRIDDRIGMIGDIAHLKDTKIDASILAALTTKANEALLWRDLVAHGVWIPNPDGGGWLLQRISGSYPKNYQAEHRKRRVNPEGLNVGIEGLRAVSEDIEALIQRAEKLRTLVERQLPPLPDKHRE